MLVPPNRMTACGLNRGRLVTDAKGTGNRKQTIVQMTEKQNTLRPMNADIQVPGGYLRSGLAVKNADSTE